jgi:hypothetical protein
MADHTDDSRVDDPTVEVDRPRVTLLNWKGIIAGALASLAVAWLLLTLGAAIGVTAVEPHRPVWMSTAGAAGLGAWAVASVGIGSFLGGLISVRASAITQQFDAVLQGLTTWSIGFLFSAVVAGLLGAVAASNVDDDVMASMSSRAEGRASAEQSLAIPAGEPGRADVRDERMAERADEASEAAAWTAFGTGLLGALAGMAGGALALQPVRPSRGTNRRATFDRPAHGTSP